MPGKLVYEYAFIRYVPKVEREEFINIGVILYCKAKKFLEVKYHLDEPRMLAFYRETDFLAIRHYLETWHCIAEGNPRCSPVSQQDLPERFRWLTATRSTIIQPSKVHPGLCEDPALTLDELYRHYVL
ncbi:MAG: DUF3037 domain-containing protein [Saprospiraceae bacterium]